MTATATLQRVFDAVRWEAECREQVEWLPDELRPAALAALKQIAPDARDQLNAAVAVVDSLPDAMRREVIRELEADLAADAPETV